MNYTILKERTSTSLGLHSIITFKTNDLNELPPFFNFPKRKEYKVKLTFINFPQNDNFIEVAIDVSANHRYIYNYLLNTNKKIISFNFKREKGEIDIFSLINFLINELNVPEKNIKPIHNIYFNNILL